MGWDNHRGSRARQPSVRHIPPRSRQDSTTSWPTAEEKHTVLTEVHTGLCDHWITAATAQMYDINNLSRTSAAKSLSSPLDRIKSMPGLTSGTIPKGSAATYLRYGGNNGFYWKLPYPSSGKRTLKISWDLTKLPPWVWWHLFGTRFSNL